MGKVTERQLVSFDWAVKKLLRSKANFEILEGFLSELLFDDIKILEVLESESNKEDENDKFNRVDIKVKNGKNEIIAIEVQFNNELDFFQRILHSSSKTVCEHLDEGDSYGKIVKVISINIVYFDLGEGDDYIYRGQTVFNGFHNNKQLKLNHEQKQTFNKEYPSEIFPEFYIIKVKNFNDVARSPLDEWIYLFKNSSIKSDFKAKGIQKAGKVLDKMKMSKAERQIYDRFIDNRRIALSQLITAQIEGRSEERKIQEERIKQLEKKHVEELQEKDSQLQEKDNQLQEKDSVIQENKLKLQEKDNQLQEQENLLKKMEKLLLDRGLTKEDISKI